jgi:hypothetical protein
MYLTGPGKYNKRRKVIESLDSAEIVDSFLKYKEEILPIFSNQLDIYPNEMGGYNVWHSYDYIDKNGEINVGGRWYDFNMDASALTVYPKNMLKFWIFIDDPDMNEDGAYGEFNIFLRPDFEFKLLPA